MLLATYIVLRIFYVYVKISLKRLCPLYFWKQHKKVLKLSQASHSTVQYCTVPYGTKYYSTLRYGTNLPYRTVFYRSVRYRTDTFTRLRVLLKGPFGDTFSSPCNSGVSPWNLPRVSSTGSLGFLGIS